ncbi:hypothetical protein G7074_06205 [Pedobacter sp. HDW13]|uniref:hypothetical protein n=1 Tax=unclassified Pedobacter TaxID=2628915 RepID=UPI000F59C19A|nr:MULTISPECIES: hypothetical protein [unclassified Pedobacter]QIL38907.1 hypothetical protein G7074_06205 [Pedobacter sp. HDW13]RQO72551.1 hypothetical protein DBR40_14670 [Pedobacter sp. KBW01]
MKKISFLIVFLILNVVQLYAQCLCADIKFRLLLPDLQFKNGTSNYSIKTLVSPSFIPNGVEQKLNKIQFKKDTLNLQFRTSGGIKELTFEIKNNNTGVDMLITALNMQYDIPYVIDLTTFSAGHFLFDWKVINKCQKENRSSELIACEGLKFYQTGLAETKQVQFPNGFVSSKIKVFDLSYFKIKETK